MYVYVYYSYKYVSLSLSLSLSLSACRMPRRTLSARSCPRGSPPCARITAPGLWTHWTKSWSHSFWLPSRRSSCMGSWQLATSAAPTPWMEAAAVFPLVLAFFFGLGSCEEHLVHYSNEH